LPSPGQRETERVIVVSLAKAAFEGADEMLAPCSSAALPELGVERAPGVAGLDFCQLGADVLGDERFVEVEVEAEIVAGWRTHPWDRDRFLRSS
jgi:hypothetical protein